MRESRFGGQGSSLTAPFPANSVTSSQVPFLNHPLPLSLKNTIRLSTPVMNTQRTARLGHGTASSYIYLSSGGRAPFRQ